MHLKFTPRVFVRALIIFLSLVIVLLVIVSFLPGPILQNVVYLGVGITHPPDPTPLPPTLTVPQGELPAGPVGLQELAAYSSEAYRPVGSGFLLRLDDGTVVGVTTAHSVGDIGEPANALERIAFAALGAEGYAAEFDTLYGLPGVTRTGDDMTVDWVLLQLDGPVDPTLVLAPDSRGGPQPGERVVIYSGRGDGARIEGTVQSVDPKAIWVLMDPTGYPGGMSGSPLLSQHTGQVVGMAIAVVPRSTRWLMAFHPIGSLVAKAEAAAVFPKISDFRR